VPRHSDGKAEDIQFRSDAIMKRVAAGETQVDIAEDIGMDIHAVRMITFKARRTAAGAVRVDGWILKKDRPAFKAMLAEVVDKVTKGEG
jgi:hypothetical protein